MQMLDKIEAMMVRHAAAHAKERKPKNSEKPWKVVFEFKGSSHYDNETDTIHYVLDHELDEYTLSHEVIHAVLERIDPVASVLIDLVRYGFERDTEEKEKLCDKAKQCEVLSGIDCLACDVYWKWKSRE